MASTINASTSAGLVTTADTSGVLVLQSNGTTALTTSGANVTIAGTLTAAAQSIAKASLPAGTVLQVVEGSTSTTVAVSTTSYVDTGLTASITPSSASSKILVIFSQQASSNRTATTGDMNLDLRLLRDATVLVTYADYALYVGAGSLSAVGMQISATYLDSPATTSSTTYKLQGAPDSTANGQTANFQQGNRGRSSIILMEIAA
jgi:hypothetical protein